MDAGAALDLNAVSEANRWPVALSVCGFDGSGGAGFHADLRAFERCGVYGAGVLTAMVVQSPGRVVSVLPMDAVTVRQQFEELSAAFPIAAAKTGMLAAAEIVEESANFFAEHPGIPLVADPVLRASTGDPLTAREAFELAAERLFPRACLITPNLPEAETLLGRKIGGREEFAGAATELGERLGTAVLLKGGHFEGSAAGLVSDCLYLDGATEWMSGARLEVPDLHGTGCALSALVTAHLAKGTGLRDSIIGARETLRQWMDRFYQWKVGERRTYALNSGCERA